MHRYGFGFQRSGELLRPPLFDVVRIKEHEYVPHA
jgi:hypothetical protein